MNCYVQAYDTIIDYQFECNILRRFKMSFPDGYSRTKFINELKFGIQSDTTNKKVKFVIKLIQLPVSKWKWFQQAFKFYAIITNW